jgi:hypothetical protein
MARIKFIASSKDYYDIFTRPVPANNSRPSWWNKMQSYTDGKKGVDLYGDPTSTVKKCMPVFDMMTTGYHITLPCDVWITNDGTTVSFKPSSDDIRLITGQRKDQYEHYHIDKEYHKMVFKWINSWIVNTPKGWSCLFVHPYHYEDLPFRTLSGLVDTDKYPAPVNFPFLFRKDFEGLIPKGTPIVQIIPFKREKMTHEYNYDTGFFKKLWDKAHTEFFNRYGKNFREKKVYEEKKCPFA